MTAVIVILFVVGLNTLLWSLAGVARVISARVAPPLTDPATVPSRSDVAVMIAAHNEELVIAQTIRSAASMLPVENIFVVSDGSTDRTSDIAMQEGATVLELSPNRGKARALHALIDEFELVDRFEVVLLLDADTQLAPDYFETGLQLFRDNDVVAVAGRATSVVEAPGAGLTSRIMVAHRERVYIAVQYLHKFGQAARRLNVVSIVPGFASMYRTRILDDIDIEAEGLIIEDYNMTFEVHAKRLGRIAFHPLAAIAYTQDPNTLADYVKQVSRWNLGFWQTLRRHGMHVGRFWTALGFFTAELVISSVVMLAFPLLLLGLLAAVVVDAYDGSAPTFASQIIAALPPLLLLAGVLLLDYALTIFAAIVARSPSMLVLGLAFPLLRVIDSYVCLRALGRAFRHSTSGLWVSPERRQLAAS